MKALLFALFPLTVVVLAGCGPSSAQAGTQAPAIDLTSVDNDKSFSTADLKGKVVVVDFWATWCPPCREMLPEVDQLSQDYGSKGVKVIGVSSEDKAAVASFLKGNPRKYEMCVAKGETAEKAFDIEGYPTMIVISANGEVAYRGMPPEIADVRSTLDRLVK